MPSIKPEHANQLFSYITGIIKNKNSHLYRINGTENHLHILTDLHPSYALSDFMRELKVSTSVWMKESGLFPCFEGWADGYGSFTCSYIDLGDLIDYIKNQPEHHRRKSFEEEYPDRSVRVRWCAFNKPWWLFLPCLSEIHFH
jgi:REP element-mobilizing transposase RayT